MEEIEITVIDDSSGAGWLAAASRISEIYMRDVRSMVTNVISKAGKRKIKRLNILDHGTYEKVEIGNDSIYVHNFSKYQPTLRLLRGHFAKDGFVHLQHCDIGNNFVLLFLFAQTFGVPVVAGTGKHNGTFRYNHGHYNRCDPSGTCKLNVKRP